MAQLIVIDGYNVIHQIHEYMALLDTGLEAAREKLIHDLTTYRSQRHVNIVLVFDGIADVLNHHGKDRIKGIEIIYSKAPMKADPVIKKKISTRNKRMQTVVVTNDGDIRKFSKDAGAIVLSPQEFYLRLTNNRTDLGIEGKFQGNMTPEELDEWKKLFGID